MKLRIKEIRMERQMTQRQVADLAGMSVSYYTEIELGKKTLNARRLEAIAKALRVQPADLIIDERDTEQQQLLREIKKLTPDERALVTSLIRRLTAPSEPE